MELKRTVVCKVSDKITKKKLSFLDKITARITYCVNSYINLIEREYENVKTEKRKISKSNHCLVNLLIEITKLREN